MQYAYMQHIKIHTYMQHQAYIHTDTYIHTDISLYCDLEVHQNEGNSQSGIFQLSIPKTNPPLPSPIIEIDFLKNKPSTPPSQKKFDLFPVKMGF